MMDRGRSRLDVDTHTASVIYTTKHYSRLCANKVSTTRPLSKEQKAGVPFANIEVIKNSSTIQLVIRSQHPAPLNKIQPAPNKKHIPTNTFQPTRRQENKATRIEHRNAGTQQKNKCLHIYLQKYKTPRWRFMTKARTKRTTLSRLHSKALVF